MTRSLLRLAAAAIAVAGAIDPAVTRQSAAPQSVVIAMIDANTLTAGDRPSARGERASAGVASLRAGLAGDHDVFVRTHRQGSLAAACPAHGQCIVVSDGAVPRRLTDGAQVIGGIRVDAAERPRLAIVGVEAPATASPHSVAQLRLRLRAIGARGDSHLQVFDAGALVGETTHTWRETAAVNDVDESITVSWVPLASGPRRIRVVVSALENEETLADNEADLVVDVRVEPVAVLMYEPEATWLGTFVRRALEDDPRFQVRGRVRMAPPVTVSRRGGGSLTRETLDATRAVIVTAPNLLTDGEIDLLERFVRIRGGSALLLLDRRPSGRIAQLALPVADERREAKPVAVGMLKASELLTFRSAAVGLTIVAAADADPVIVSRAMGRGRVIASGALDAWRFRGVDGEFAHFWTGLVAEAAAASGAPVAVSVRQLTVAPGDRMDLNVEWRTTEEIGSDLEAAAEVECEKGGGFARLWPGARPGVFLGTVEVTGTGPCQVEVSIDGADQKGVARFVTASDVRRVHGDARQLESAVAAHGGIVVASGQEAALLARMRDDRVTEPQPRATWPMRSPWWVVPFAAFLCAEWWLRRRAGFK